MLVECIPRILLTCVLFSARTIGSRYLNKYGRSHPLTVFYAERVASSRRRICRFDITWNQSKLAVKRYRTCNQCAISRSAMLHLNPARIWLRQTIAYSKRNAVIGLCRTFYCRSSWLVVLHFTYTDCETLFSFIGRVYHMC